MARPHFDRAAAIRALIDAMHLGDDEAARKHCISHRTLRRYRERLEGAPELAAAVQLEKEANDASWREELGRVRIAVLRKVAQVADTSDNLFHLSGALKILSDAANADDVIKALGGDGGGLGSAGPGSTQPNGATPEAPRRALAILSGGKR
jgi:hypothetical protein